MNKTIIVAIDKNNGIAKNDELPWTYKEDLNHFREYTMNKVCIVGNTTYKALPDLDDRFLINLKSKPSWVDYFVTSCFYAKNITSAYIRAEKIIKNLKLEKEICIIGGASVYYQTFRDCNTFIVTYIKKNYSCDKFCHAEILNLTLATACEYALAKIPLDFVTFDIMQNNRDFAIIKFQL